MVVFPPQFGRCQRGRLLKAISGLLQVALNPCSGAISLNAHDKRHSVTPTIPGYPGENFPLPPDREFGPHRNGSVDSNADPGGGCVLDLGGSQVRCAGLVFPANLSDSHHRGSRFAGLGRRVHDFYYIDRKAPGLNTVWASTYDWTSTRRNRLQRCVLERWLFVVGLLPGRTTLAEELALVEFSATSRLNDDAIEWRCCDESSPHDADQTKWITRIRATPPALSAIAALKNCAGRHAGRQQGLTRFIVRDGANIPVGQAVF
jgi:hypothetical protein